MPVASLLKGKRIRIRYITKKSEDAVLLSRLLKEAGAKVTLKAYTGSFFNRGLLRYADETFLEAALHIQKMGTENYFDLPTKEPNIAKQNLDLLVVLR